MSTELTITAGLAEQINAEHAAAKSAATIALNHALECGRLLAEARQQIPHGRWLDWLAENVQFSARTAQVYQRLHERRDVLPNAQRVALLPVREAIRLLAEAKAATPPAPPDAKYLPAAGEYLEFVKVGSLDLFVLVAPSAADGYFYVTRSVIDTQGAMTLEGLKKPMLAGYAANLARQWVRELRDAGDGVRFSPAEDGFFGPLPWDYNRLLYTSRQYWLDCWLGAA